MPLPDTHAAVRKLARQSSPSAPLGAQPNPPGLCAVPRRRVLRDADISEQQAEALVEVFSHAIGEPATKDDIKNLATKAELTTELVALEARLTWRFAGAMLAQTLAILGGVLAILRLPTS